MDYAKAKEKIIGLLKKQGKARNSEMIKLVGDETLFHEIREELIFDDIADDKKNVGLIYIGSSSTAGTKTNLNNSTKPSKDQDIDFFVSYSTEDREIAHQLVNTLESSGIRCWIAPRDIQKDAGKDYAECLIEALYSSKGMVLVFSSKANESQFVKAEVDRAVARKIPLIAFRVEKEEPTGAMEFYLCTSQWLDAMPPPASRHLDKLLEITRSRLKTETPSPPKKEDLKRLTNAFRKSESENPAYSAFWIGSRIASALSLYSESLRMDKNATALLHKSLFGAFSRHEKLLLIEHTAEKAFTEIHATGLQQTSDRIKKKYITDLGSEIYNRHGSDIVQWMTIGVAISSLWSQFKYGGKSVSKEQAINIVKSSFASIDQMHQVSPLAPALYKKIKTLETKFNSSPHNFTELEKIIQDLSIAIEAFLIIDECEISCELIQPIIEKNPNFAVYALKRYLELNPNDSAAYHLCGKACAAEIYSSEPVVDPLFSIDKVETMAWSLEESIKRETDSENKKQMQNILSSICKFRRNKDNRPDIRETTHTRSGSTSALPSRGKLLWHNVFKDSSLKDWSIFSYLPVDWKAAHGICSGNGLGFLISKSSSWGNFIFQGKARIMSAELGPGGIMLLACHQTGQKYPSAYHFTIRKDCHVVGERFNGKEKPNSYFMIPHTITMQNWMDFRLTAFNNHFYLFIDNHLIGDFKDSQLRDGAIGIGVVKATAEFKDISVYSAVENTAPGPALPEDTQSGDTEVKRGLFQKIFNRKS